MTRITRTQTRQVDVTVERQDDGSYVVGFSVLRERRPATFSSASQVAADVVSWFHQLKPGEVTTVQHLRRDASNVDVYRVTFTRTVDEYQV